MEYYELIKVLKDRIVMQCIGVLLPCYFQWSMLDRFRSDLPERIVIPIDRGMLPLEINEIVLSHNAYFPCTQIILLYDQKIEYAGIEEEYCLYGQKAIEQCASADAKSVCG